MQFQSTRPMRGATRSILRSSSRPINFNPRAPCGARPRSWTSMTRRCDFNPRAPCGARPQQLLGQCAGMAFQSTRPVRGATTLQELEFVGQVMHISIHAPHAGATASERAKTCCKCLFQSTRPMRGATGAGSPGRFFQSDFNPRAPCGARPRQDLRGHLCGLHFNPRAPCGARRVVIAAPHHRPVISIHAPHAGRDHHGW